MQSGWKKRFEHCFDLTVLYRTAGQEFEQKYAHIFIYWKIFTISSGIWKICPIHFKIISYQFKYNSQLPAKLNSHIQSVCQSAVPRNCTTFGNDDESLPKRPYNCCLKVSRNDWIKLESLSLYASYIKTPIAIIIRPKAPFRITHVVKSTRDFANLGA